MLHQHQFGGVREREERLRRWSALARLLVVSRGWTGLILFSPRPFNFIFSIGGLALPFVHRLSLSRRNSFSREYLPTSSTRKKDQHRPFQKISRFAWTPRKYFSLIIYTSLIAAPLPLLLSLLDNLCAIHDVSASIDHSSTKAAPPASNVQPRRSIWPLISLR